MIFPTKVVIFLKPTRLPAGACPPPDPTSSPDLAASPSPRTRARPRVAQMLPGLRFCVAGRVRQERVSKVLAAAGGRDPHPRSGTLLHTRGQADDRAGLRGAMVGKSERAVREIALHYSERPRSETDLESFL